MPLNNWVDEDEDNNQAVKTLKQNMISRLENEQVLHSKSKDNSQSLF